MNATSALGAAVVALTLATVPAHAFMSSRAVVPAASSAIAPVDFVQGHEVLAGIPAREFARSESTKAMAERYFDADVVVTLGALAIASGAFVAAGLAGGLRRERTAPKPALRDGWRVDVLQAVEADLMQFCEGLRHAA
jgi:hypothetical protein